MEGALPSGQEGPAETAPARAGMHHRPRALRRTLFPTPSPLSASTLRQSLLFIPRPLSALPAAPGGGFFSPLAQRHHLSAGGGELNRYLKMRSQSRVNVPDGRWGGSALEEAAGGMRWTRGGSAGEGQAQTRSSFSARLQPLLLSRLRILQDSPQGAAWATLPCEGFPGRDVAPTRSVQQTPNP